MGKNKRKNLKKKEAPETLLQAFLTYSIMTTIFVVTLLLVWGSGGSKLTPLKIAEKAVEAFSPTTITFVGVFLLNHKYFELHRLRGAVLVFLLVAHSLVYIAFSSLHLNNGLTEITLALAYGNFGIIFLAALVIFAPARRRGGSKTDPFCNEWTDDGSTSARKRQGKTIRKKKRGMTE